MKVYFQETALVVEAETDVEAYALQTWMKAGNIHGVLEIKAEFPSATPKILQC